MCLILFSRLLKHTAGSSGDPKAPQLIVENRAVTLEYARDQESRPRDGDREGSRRAPPKTDWLCEQVLHMQK
jgi:hypothetical protein